MCRLIAPPGFSARLAIAKNSGVYRRAAGVSGMVDVRKLLDRSGGTVDVVASLDAAALVTDGFWANVEDQTTHVFGIQ